MNREEAVEALALLRQVVSRARDETTLQNWGLIWVTHGVTNAAGFGATNWLLEHSETIRAAPFAVLWGAVLLFNLACVLGLRERSGTPSFVDTQLWAIWTTFIAAGTLTAWVNYWIGTQLIFTGPVLAILAAVAFSSMGSLIDRRFFAFAALFALAAVAMALWPRWQFLLFGALWGAVQIAAGLRMHREKLRRLRAGGAAAGLV